MEGLLGGGALVGGAASRSEGSSGSHVAEACSFGLAGRTVSEEFFDPRKVESIEGLFTC